MHLNPPKWLPKILTFSVLYPKNSSHDEKLAVILGFFIDGLHGDIGGLTQSLWP